MPEWGAGMARGITASGQMKGGEGVWQARVPVPLPDHRPWRGAPPCGL